MWVVIETSQEDGLIAAISEGRVIREVSLQKPMRSSQYLMEELKVITGLGELDGIVAGVGPGSYTGARVGVAVAKALSFARRIPLVSVCTLAGYADQSLVAVDARMGGVYCYRKGCFPIKYSLAEFECLSSKEPVVYSPHPDTIAARLHPDLSVNWEKKRLSAKLLWQEAQGKPGYLDGSAAIFYL